MIELLLKQMKVKSIFKTSIFLNTFSEIVLSSSHVNIHCTLQLWLRQYLYFLHYNRYILENPMAEITII